MLHAPIPLALWICDRVIVDAATNDLSLIGAFTGLKSEQFPSFPRPLSVFYLSPVQTGVVRLL